MEKWITKDGLTAIFKDAVMAPVNLAKAAYKVVYEDGSKAFAAWGIGLAIYVQTPGLIIGAGLWSSFGPLGGAAGLIMGAHILSAIYKCTGPHGAEAYWPNVVDYAKKLDVPQQPSQPQ